MLLSMGSERVGQDLLTEQHKTQHQKTKQLYLKWVEDLNGHFSKENMVN